MSGMRDLVGYGATPPHPRWPGGARIAVQFVINYEEGGERSVLYGDGESEAFLHEVVGGQPIRGRRERNVESVYEYGSRAGFWRLHRLFTAAGFPVTVYGVTTALEQNPEAVAAMVASDWEVASHALRWIDYGGMDIVAERAQMADAIARHTAVVGSRPLGWYTGRISPNTRRLVVEEGGFLYSSDDYSDDLPYYTTEFASPHLIIPYTLDANDMRFATLQGFNAGPQFYDYLKDAFDILYEEGATAPKMMSVGLHCRLVGRPGRAQSLKRFIDYVAGKPDVWVCRREDIARHWLASFPPAAAA
ncbi:MAG: allantoinase PuuE [Pseudomonadota bacterium]